MNDMRNYAVWEDEEIPTKLGKRKKKKKQWDQEDEPSQGPCTCTGTYRKFKMDMDRYSLLGRCYPPTNDSTPDAEVSEKTAPTLAPVTAETETICPSAILDIFASSSPTLAIIALLFDAPSEEDCLTIQNGQMIPGQEELSVETLYIDMDVTLGSTSSGMEMADVTTLLADKIKYVLATTTEKNFLGKRASRPSPRIYRIQGRCYYGNFFLGRASRPKLEDDAAMKYIIANTSVDVFQSANVVCTAPTGSLSCFKVAVLFVLAVKANNVKYLTLYRRISSFCGEDVDQKIVSSHGIFSISLNIEVQSFTIPNRNIGINGRLLGDQFPGPTLRLKAGDKLQIAFSNYLSDQGYDLCTQSILGSR